MKKMILAALAAAMAAGVMVVSLSSGSSHREAPNIMLDPTADNTDVYAFKAPDQPNKLTVVANWVPGENPANGPNFFRFDDRADYYINIDNTGDGKPNVRYLFRFNTRLRNKGSFLYAVPPVDNIFSKNLNVIQRYKVIREDIRKRKGKDKKRRKVIARGLPVAPSNVGSKTMPDYGKLAGQAVRNLRGNARVFAGQRDDPFFIDLGATFDSIHIATDNNGNGRDRPDNSTGNGGGGRDDFAGTSIESVVLQLPEKAVTRDGKRVSGPDAKNAVVGVWSSTERRALEVTNGRFDKQAVPKADRSRHVKRSRGHRVQVSRLGNPLINELVIPLGTKDKFNRTTPDRDAKLYGKFVLKPELAAVINLLFPQVNAPENNRTDIVQALLTGIPGVTQISKKPAAADTLKINLGVPPTQTPNRFGVLGGDNAGFPNGRRLTDDVVDIQLQVVAGFLKGNKVPLGDGVDQNDKQFTSTFPYLAPPTGGYDSAPGQRVEPQHDPVPAGG